MLAPRLQVDDAVKQKVFTALKKDWLNTAENIATSLQINTAQAAGALSAYTQAGRVIYDLNSKLYRLRELSREPLPFDKLRFSNPQEELAAEILEKQEVKHSIQQLPDGTMQLTGTVKGKKKTFNAALVIDADEKIKSAHCDCSFYTENKLYKGPCEHMLAIRQQFNKTRIQTETVK